MHARVAESGERRKIRVLFLCGANSCRSQMAEGWARALFPDRLDPRSAGIAPRELDVRAVRVMGEAGVDISGQRPKHAETLIGQTFDCIITLCSEVDEQCPIFPGPGRRVHQAFLNPASAAANARTEDEALAPYRQVRDAIRAFVAGTFGDTVAPSIRVRAGDRITAFDDARAEIERENMLARIWLRDHTVWKPEPTEIENRLGWLDAPRRMDAEIAEYERFADELHGEGFAHALLLGMGGSSLAPEVFRRVLGASDDRLDLDVLDSTDPGAILEKTSRGDPLRTLFIVSTKSGGTVETLSLAKYCFRRVVAAGGREAAGRRFIAITDPGSSLEQFARNLGFRRVFFADPHVGGRYSALTAFGLVPAALIGADLRLLQERTAAAASDCAIHCRPVAGSDPAIGLGAFMGGLARSGRDKLTLLTAPPFEPFGPWIEQLIAESTGKEGRGILPVVGETGMGIADYGSDRQFVSLAPATGPSPAILDTIVSGRLPLAELHLRDIYDIGAQCFIWEMATAIAGALLRVQPFDQPNVEAAKRQAREMLAEYQESGRLPDDRPQAVVQGIEIHAPFAAASVADAFAKLLTRMAPGGDGQRPRSYLALQAYLHPRADVEEQLQVIRRVIASRMRIAVTVGYGPRFLHSTGQLHKGDAGHGLFVQLTSDPIRDLPIPDSPEADDSTLTFGVLERAQALGDRRALLSAGRPVMRLHLGNDPLAGLRAIVRAVQSGR